MILSVENNVNDGDTGNRKFFQIKISGHFFLARFAFVSVTYCAAGGRCQELVVNKSPVIN